MLPRLFFFFFFCTVTLVIFILFIYSDMEHPVPVHDASEIKITQSILYCSKCNTFRARTGFYKHKRKCQGDQTEHPKPMDMLNLSQKMKGGFQDVISGLHEDEVGILCKTDPTILLVGTRLYEDKTKPEKSMEIKKTVRASMRMLARLYLHFKEEKPDSCEVKDLWNREYFYALRTEVNKMSEKESEAMHEADVKYGLKNNLYYLLLNAANFLKGSFLEKKGEESSADEMERFITVLKMNQNLLFGDAKYFINKARQERLRLPSRTPQEEDIHKLKHYTVSKISELTGEYEFIGKHEFVLLRNSVCSRLTLFNVRRGGEPCRLKLSQWIQRDKWMPKQQLESLDEIDKELVKSMQITYQAGKGNKLVPCLVPRDCVHAMDILCQESVRASAGVLPTNQYIFANTEGSTAHVIGWDTVHNMCTAAGIANSSLNATNNRGRISTLYAALETRGQTLFLFAYGTYRGC